MPTQRNPEQLVGQIRARWPRTRIVLRADSGFAREALEPPPRPRQPQPSIAAPLARRAACTCGLKQTHPWGTAARTPGGDDNTNRPR